MITVGDKTVLVNETFIGPDGDDLQTKVGESRIEPNEKHCGSEPIAPL